MTEEQKDFIIAKMIDSPASLSAEELDMIEHDAELRDIYMMSAAVSGACANTPEPDMAEEWKRFRPRLRRRPSAMRRMMRIAAIWLAITASSWIVIRLINEAFSPGEPSLTASVEQPDDNNRTKAPVSESVTVREETDAPSEAPAMTDAPSSPPSTPNDSDDMIDPEAILRASGAELEDYMRIYRAGIDNSLALQTAEVYSAEYDDLMVLLSLLGEESASLGNDLTRLTME